MVHKNMDTGEITKAEYNKYIWLKKNAVPSVFSNYSQYLTKQSTSRSFSYRQNYLRNWEKIYTSLAQSSQSQI